MECLFTDLKEGFNIIYNIEHKKIGLVRLRIEDNYGSISITALNWTDTKNIFCKLYDWQGNGDIFIENKEYCKCKTYEEAEEVIDTLLLKFYFHN